MSFLIYDFLLFSRIVSFLILNICLLFLLFYFFGYYISLYFVFLLDTVSFLLFLSPNPTHIFPHHTRLTPDLTLEVRGQSCVVWENPFMSRGLGEQNLSHWNVTGWGTGLAIFWPLLDGHLATFWPFLTASTARSEG